MNGTSVPVLEAEGLTKHYPVSTGFLKPKATVQALQAVSFSLAAGRTLAVVGESGCGKSTLARQVTMLERPTAGRLSLAGRDVAEAGAAERKAFRRTVQMVFQNPFASLNPRKKIGQALEEPLAINTTLAAGERAERARAMLARVGLRPEHHARYPHMFSGGQRQRVAISRALVISPPVLLLDEPLSNLDAKLREEMQFELRRIQRKVGTTTIMVTHDQAEALSISDRVVVMEAGRATQVDAPYRLYEHPKSEFISGFVGKTNLLAGTVARGTAGAEAVLGAGQRVRVDAGDFADGSHVTVCLRPEKLFFTDEARGTLAGRVEERFFLGSQWLYRVSSPLGELEVSAANDGSAPVEEQASVHLAWADDVARVVAKAS